MSYDSEASFRAGISQVLPAEKLPNIPRYWALMPSRPRKGAGDCRIVQLKAAIEGQALSGGERGAAQRQVRRKIRVQDVHIDVDVYRPTVAGAACAFLAASVAVDDIQNSGVSKSLQLGAIG